MYFKIQDPVRIWMHFNTFTSGFTSTLIVHWTAVITKKKNILLQFCLGALIFFESFRSVAGYAHFSDGYINNEALDVIYKKCQYKLDTTKMENNTNICKCI